MTWPWGRLANLRLRFFTCQHGDCLIFISWFITTNAPQWNLREELGTCSLGSTTEPSYSEVYLQKTNFDSVLSVDLLSVCFLPPTVARMKKTSSSTLRRAWPSSDLPPAASVEPHRSRRSRSEKDYRIHKHSKRNHYPPQYQCQSPPAYIHTGTVWPHRQNKNGFTLVWLGNMQWDAVHVLIGSSDSHCSHMFMSD